MEPRFDRALPAVPATVTRVRGEITEWVRELGLPDEDVHAVRLSVSEAVTNVVMHAYVGRDAGEVRVIAETGRDCLVVRVIDEGMGIGPRHDSPGLGMGLPLIARLTSNLDVREASGAAGAEITMVFPAAGLAGPALDADDELGGILSALGRMSAREGFGGRDIGALAEMLVPRFADVATITLLDADETVHRLSGYAAHPDGSPDEEGSAFVLGFPPTAAGAPSYLAVVTGTTQIAEVTDAWCERVSPDHESAQRLKALDLAWWCAVPLRVGDQPVGSVAIGLRESRGEPHPIVAAVERAAAHAGGLVATARLVDELRRTRRRLERILGAVPQGIVVSDAEGWVVYANDAAARLFGVPDVDALYDAEPGELIGAFDLFDEAGNPLQPPDMPHRRLLEGLPADSMVVRGVKRDSGDTVWARVTSSRLDEELGDEVLVVSLLEDLTDGPPQT